MQNRSIPVNVTRHDQRIPEKTRQEAIMSIVKQASLECSVSWKSDCASHTDSRCFPKSHSPFRGVQGSCAASETGCTVHRHITERWFPTKVLRLWAELHAFERTGLVVDYFRRSEVFDHIRTETSREQLRPEDDMYAGVNP
jgi:hypothetical protein